MDTLAISIAAWRETAGRALVLLRGLSPDAWDRDTDCPGWTVRDVVAHLADMEIQLADGSGSATDRAPPEGGTARVSGREVTPEWTSPGVAARRGSPPAALVAELADAVRRRAAELEQHPPADPHGRPAFTPAGLGWDWETLLRNRAIDLWVHEQDVRRAVGAPGGMDSLGAGVAVRTFAAALPYVLGKRVAPPAGTVVGIRVEGPVSVRTVLAVGEDGRARPVDGEPEGCTWLGMGTETFAALAAGRRSASDSRLKLAGDRALAMRLAGALAVTP